MRDMFNKKFKILVSQVTFHSNKQAMSHIPDCPALSCTVLHVFRSVLQRSAHFCKNVAEERADYQIVES